MLSTVTTGLSCIPCSFSKDKETYIMQIVTF